MDDQIQTSQEKSISEQLSEVLDSLTPDQLRFVVAMQEFKTKQDAAKAIGLKPDTVYHWNGNIDRAVILFKREALETARAIALNNLIKAMMVKVNGLDSNDEAIRQKVATEIIEMGLGKVMQQVDVGGTVLVKWVDPDEN